MLKKSRINQEDVNVNYNTDKPYNFSHTLKDTYNIPDNKLNLKLAHYLDRRLNQYYERMLVPPLEMPFYFEFNGKGYRGDLLRVYDCVTTKTLSISRRYSILDLEED